MDPPLHLIGWARTVLEASGWEHRPSFFKEDHEELERHLRDPIALLIQRGFSGEETFRKACAPISDVIRLEKTYPNTFWR